MSENVLPTATCQKKESAKTISDKHPHTELIATCKVAHGDVNAHHALECCHKQWSNDLGRASITVFYDTFAKPMVTIVLCGKWLYDQEMIYERMIVLMSSNRSVPIDTCMITDRPLLYSSRDCDGYTLKHTHASGHEEADHMLFQQYQGEKVTSTSDDKCVNPSSLCVCLPHVYTCFAHELTSGKSLDCGSGSNNSEEQGHAKGHPGDAHTMRG